MCPGRRHRSIFRSMQRRQYSQSGYKFHKVFEVEDGLEIRCISGSYGCGGLGMYAGRECGKLDSCGIYT